MTIIKLSENVTESRSYHPVVSFFKKHATYFRMCNGSGSPSQALVGHGGEEKTEPEKEEKGLTGGADPKRD